MNTKRNKILLVVSAYNEQGAILDTINDIVENAPQNIDVLVIDNCSTDSTLAIVKQSGVDYLSHAVNTGGSSGVIKTAFRYAYLHNYDIYCHMDGDNQHMASELVKLLKPLIDGNDIDVTTGSRYIENEGFQSTLARRLGIRLFSGLMSLITKKKYTDITSGFRAYNRKAVDFFGRQYRNEIETVYEFEFAMYLAGLKSQDVPVVMRPRTSGKSQINFINAIKFPVYNVISLVGILIQRRKF